MKPYYEHAGITLYHGDCREILPGLGRFDLLLTDPPYGIGVCDRSDGGVGSASSGSKVYGRVAWDKKTPDASTISASIHGAKSAIIWGGNYFGLPGSSRWLIWDKGQRGFTFADAEMAWTNISGAIRIFTYTRGELVAEGKQHPTQKPVPLMQWCISFANDAETILDPFAGSGTTLVAAKLEGRKAVGIEINERYCEIAAKRLAQGVLF